MFFNPRPQVLCTDMFFGRAAQSPISGVMDAGASNTWEYALGLASSSSHKYNVLSRCVVLLRKVIITCWRW